MVISARPGTTAATSCSCGNGEAETDYQRYRIVQVREAVQKYLESPPERDRAEINSRSNAAYDD